MKNLNCSSGYLFACLFAASMLQAQTIKLDPDFGIAGKILTQISPGDDKGNAMALLPDGKIILAGNTLGSPGNVDWALAQYLPNGKLDTAFGDKGIVITDFGNADESANAIAVQPDGKIILAGYTTNSLTNRDFALARYLPNGTLDSSFGNAGRVTTDSLSGVQTALCLLLLPNGYIVAAGTSGPIGSVGFFLAQYDTNGNLNPTFGTNGFVSKFYSHHDNIYAIALQPDGKLVATGYTEEFGFMTHTLFFATIRLLPNGALDNTFGSNGLVKTSFGVNTIYAASCLSIFPNGNILVGGYDFGKKVALVMYHPDGTPDLSFGVNGKVTTLIGDKPSKAYSVALLNNGKFLVGGTVTNDNGYEDFFLSRFFSNGNPDSSFGQNGALITDFQNSRDEARAMAVQADGQVVLSGFGGKRETNDFALRRLNPDGSFDNAFGNAGTVLTDFDFKDDRLTSIALKPDGRILAAGYSTSSNMGNDYAFIQYLSDGQLDPDFGDAGKKTINLGTSFERANAVSIQPDGKIIAAGSKQHQNISQYYHSIVMRLNSAGNPDPTFNQTGFMVDSTFQLDETRAVRLQPDGKIITAGSGRMSMSERTDFIVRRYNANGTPDYFFSADGMVTSDINNRWDYANALALQPDGKILVAGQSEQALDAQLALLRYNSDGSPDNSFGTSGQAPSSTGSVSSIALQPDGKILTGGNADGDFRLTRFLSNGNLDNSFGINGAVSTDFAGNFDQINALALQPDGKIIAAGTIKTDLFYRMAVARYLSDGTLDDNFGDKGKVVVSQDVSDGFATSVALQPDGKIVVGGYLDAQPSYDFALLRYLTDLNVGVVDNNSDDHMVLIYPNPVGHFAQLKYTLRERTQVSIELYDLQGRMLKTFIQAESRDAGEHEEQLEMPVDMAAGAYFLSIKTPLGVRTVKIIR